MPEYSPKIKVREEDDRRFYDLVATKTEFVISFKKEFEPFERSYLWVVTDFGQKLKEVVE